MKIKNGPYIIKNNYERSSTYIKNSQHSERINT